MNVIVETFASEGWSHVIQALLHTLWIGGVATLGLFVALRFTVRPEVRYRWCVVAMTLVFLGGLVTWGVLQEKASRRATQEAITIKGLSSVSFSNDVMVVTQAPDSAAVVSTAGSEDAISSPIFWTPWLALLWLVGSALMLVRSALCVATAEGIRKSGRLLEDAAILRMLDETLVRLGIMRRIRVVVTEKLTTPAVMGVLVPTLILPLSLVTSMSLQQLQFVFLHELAHVRRGDYLANLCQLLIESMLFFNPAIWWISRQMRQEREACCDAVAIALTGGRAEYVRTLAKVAENMIAAAPQGVPAFGERKHSSLMDRAQRILVPGYRPGMSLTWKALLGSLFVGALVFVLSAVGTRLTVGAAAELISPRQRIDSIEKKMVERGTSLQADPDEADVIEVRGNIQTEDGSPVPKQLYPTFVVVRGNSSAFHSAPPKNADGVYTYQVAHGDLYFSASYKDFAPAVAGPLNTRTSTETPELSLVLKRGFNVSFKVIDIETGAPVRDALLKCQFQFPNKLGMSSFDGRQKTSDAQGKAEMEHCADYPLSVNAEAAGYEYTAVKFETLAPDRELIVAMKKSQPVRGMVLDGATGHPIAGAGVHVFRAEGLRAGSQTIPGGFSQSSQEGDVYTFSGLNPWRLGVPLTTTDAQGQFTLASLPESGRYTLLVESPGHTHGFLRNVRVGNDRLKLHLYPQVIVNGQLTGDLSKLSSSWQGKTVLARVEYRDPTGERSSSHGVHLPVRVENGVGYFTLTNKFGSAVALEVAGQRIDYPDKPTEEWHVKITGAEPFKRREVVLKFSHPSGVAPKGTIYVVVPDENSDALMRKEVEIVNGEVRAVAMVGYFGYEPARTVGYWFKAESGVQVPEGNGSFVINVPLVPAGAIYATVRNTDGSPAENVSYSLLEIKPFRQQRDPWVNVEMKEGIASPLPLGGTYRIRASRNNYVCLSDAITLTEKAPDREVEMRFEQEQDITGQVLGPGEMPIPDATLGLSWKYGNSSFGHSPAATDKEGRFAFPDASPTTGEYNLLVRAPGMKSILVPVHFKKLPLVIRMDRGMKLEGKVVEKKSGLPIPNALLNIYAANVPAVKTVTDAKGNFSADTLHDVPYRISVDGADMNGAREHRPGRDKEIVLEMILPAWSKLKVAQ